MNALQILFSRLGGPRVVGMGAIALALLGALAWVAVRGGQPSLGLLYTDLDPQAAATVTEKLAATGVPFQVSPDGTAVLAPQDRLAELRMSLAGERLGGKIGYEVLDTEEPFGVSASRARLNETRAIEGELARSIESLESVTRARVHIVMPERALFATEARKATAAVTVRTSGRLRPESVEAVRHLVSSAVPELTPGAVSVVDQTGALLARAGEEGGLGSTDLADQQSAIEARLRGEIEALLEPIVGAGKVRAEVAARLERDQTREEAEMFDPDNQVIQHQVTVENQDRNRESATAGVASVSTQLPETPDPAAAGGDTREAAKTEASEDITYGNGRKNTVKVRAPGQVQRLTVAVTVDGKGMPQAEVQRLQRLVENAVGFDGERGDSVVVEAVKFAAPPEPDALGSFLDDLPYDRLWDLASLALIAGVGIVALRMVKGRGAPAAIEGSAPIALERRTADAPALPEPSPGQPLLDQQVERAGVDGGIKLSSLTRVGDAVAASPAGSAAVIRGWMNS